MEVAGLMKLFAQGIILIMLFSVTLYTLIVGYHWFSYGSSKATSTTTLMIYLLGVLLFFVMMVASYFFL